MAALPRFASLLAACLIACVLVPTAQSASAAPLAKDNAVLYAHRSTSDSDELAGWMNTLKDDGDDTAMGPSAACNNNPSGAQGAPFTMNKMVDDQLWGADIDRTYTLTLKPGLTDGLHLDATKPIVATIAFGAGSCGGHPVINSTLAAGGVTVASAQAEHTYYPGAPYPTLVLNMSVASADLPAGQDVVWTLHLTGTYYGAGFLGVGDPQGHSSLQLPIADAPSSTGSGSGTSSSSSSSSSTGTSSGTSSSSSSSSISSSASTSHASTSSSSSSGKTTGFGLVHTKKSPGVGPLFVVALLAALAIGQRRRLPR